MPPDRASLIHQVKRRFLAWALRRAGNGTLWTLQFAAKDELGRRADEAGKAWDHRHAA